MSQDRQLEWFRRAQELSRALVEEPDPQQLVPRILDSAIELSGAERGFLVRIRGEGEEVDVSVEVARGFGGADLAGGGEAVSRSVVEEVLRRGEGIVTTRERDQDLVKVYLNQMSIIPPISVEEERILARELEESRAMYRERILTNGLAVEEAAQPRRQQIQFATENGTRIIWVLDPELKQEVLGHAEVRQVFKVSKVGTIAGCMVTDGVVQRDALIRVTRNDIVIENDRVLEQLKRFKDDAKEVRAGMECGMKIVGYDDIKEGDILECYKQVEVKRTL